MTNLDSVLKRRDITLPTKVHLVKSMVFPIVMYGYEGWTIKKAKCRRIDAFELWCWRRLLRVPRTARSNQSILKEINPKYWNTKAEAPIFSHLMWRAGPLGKTLTMGRLKARGEVNSRGQGGGWHHWPDGLEFEQALGDGEGQGSLACFSPGVTKSWSRLSD